MPLDLITTDPRAHRGTGVGLVSATYPLALGRRIVPNASERFPGVTTPADRSDALGAVLDPVTGHPHLMAQPSIPQPPTAYRTVKMDNPVILPAIDTFDTNSVNMFASIWIPDNAGRGGHIISNPLMHGHIGITRPIQVLLSCSHTITPSNDNQAVPGHITNCARNSTKLQHKVTKAFQSTSTPS